MREVRFGRGPRDVELGRLGANRVERAPCLADAGVLFVEAGAQRSRALVERLDLLALFVERADAAVEPGFRRGDRLLQLGAA